MGAGGRAGLRGAILADEPAEYLLATVIPAGRTGIRHAAAGYSDPLKN